MLPCRHAAHLLQRRSSFSILLRRLRQRGHGMRLAWSWQNLDVCKIRVDADDLPLLRGGAL
jgi:hypothetical protein